MAVADPYRWLEDPDSPESREWIESQNAHTQAFIGEVPERAELEERLTELWQHERYGVPVKRGEHWFQAFNDGVADQSTLTILDVLEGERRVLVDPNTWSSDGTVSLSGWSASADGSLVAFGLSDGGSDWVTWRVIRVSDGELLSDEVRWVKFSGVSWLPDLSGFVYGRYPEAAEGSELAGVNKNYELRLHRLGTDQSADPLLHHDPTDPDLGFSSVITDDGTTLVVHAWKGSADKNDLYVLSTSTLEQPVLKLLTGMTASFTLVGKRGSRLFLTTNADAPLSRVVSVDLDTGLPATLVEVVPEGTEALEGAALVGDRLLVTTLSDAHSRVRVFDLDGNALTEVPLPGHGTATGFSGGAEATVAHFLFTSFTTPSTILAYDLATGSVAPVFAPSVPFDPERYITEQQFVTSTDGVAVPMFVVRRRDLVPDGENPTLLYGYGGFNISLTPAFSASNVAWLERGGVFAVANLRGGGEYGDAWHEAGTQHTKQQVFDDFIACAEHLVSTGWTRPERLAIKGGSNGGLLVGATLLQRPDLFAAAVPQVGVLDMLRYHRFTIGWAWAHDYGTSEESEAMFRTLLAYSPVHNATPGAYPATLITTGDHDDRVVPAHSFKFAAALQHAQTDPAPVLIRVETRAGHGAGKSTSMVIQEAADVWAFLFETLRA